MIALDRYPREIMLRDGARLTAAGKRQLEAEVSQWRRVSLAIAFALEAS